jgi:hypothetical protein
LGNGVGGLAHRPRGLFGQSAKEAFERRLAVERRRAEREGYPSI